MTKITVYILTLEDDCFYVGKSKKIERRLFRHTIGKGSEWTKKHKLICLSETFVFDVETEKDEDKWENFITIKMMKEKGWQKVRGGYWCNVSDTLTIKGLQHHGYFMNIKFEELKEQNKKSIVFSLKLENEKYFIAYTSDLKKSLMRHQSGKGSVWTSLHKPVELMETFEIIEGRGREITDRIDELVLQYFENYGYENVRGGRFTMIDSIKHQTQIKKVIKSNPDKLYAPKLLLNLLKSNIS